MSDETPVIIGSDGKLTPSADAGSTRPKVSDFDSFKGAEATSGPSAGRGQAPGGKKAGAKNKGGRPPKNTAGFSKEKIDEEMDDPEVEAARAEFEEVLVGILVATTDGLADAKFETLKLKYPEAVARGLADKFRLTEKERDYFGKVAIRLWRKYLGDKYLFSDEGIAAAYALAYILRNFEGLSASGKIEKEKNAAASPGKQPGVQSTPDSNPRSPAGGQEHTNGADNSHAPRRTGVDL